MFDTAHDHKGDILRLHAVFNVQLVQAVDLREQSVFVLGDVVVIVLYHLEQRSVLEKGKNKYTTKFKIRENKLTKRNTTDTQKNNN